MLYKWVMSYVFQYVTMRRGVLCLYYLRGGNITIISSMRRVCIFNAVIGHFGFTGLGFFFWDFVLAF